MKTFNELLKELQACSEAIEWAGEMTIEEVVNTCHRSDWLLWLAERIGVDKRKLTLTKGHCANTVRHLMKDERSIAAVDAAIAYGKGEMTIEELNASAAAALYAAAVSSAVAAVSSAVAASYAASYASAYAADDHAAYAAFASAAYNSASAYAADAASYAASDVAYDSAYAAAAYAAYYAASDSDAARKENQMQTADICRKYIGAEIIEKVNELMN